MTERAAPLDRLRYRVTDHAIVIVVALLVLTAVGGWLVYTAHVAPPAETEVDERGSITVDGSFEHRSTVERENAVFPVGEPLEDRDRYFTRLNPTLEGDYAYVVDAENAEDVTVETDVELRLRSVEGDIEHWAEFRDVETERTTDENDETRISFAVNVSDAESQIETIERDLGASVGTTEVAVVATTTVAGTIDGERVEERDTHALAIEPDDATYRVREDGSGEFRLAVAERTDVAEERGVARAYGPILLVVLSGLATVAVAGGHVTGTLRPPADVCATIERRRARRALDDWLTRGRFPSEHAQQTIDVDSLEGVIDVAMDANRRAIEDPDRGVYFVAVNDIIYVYRLDGAPTETTDGSHEGKGGEDERETRAGDVVEPDTHDDSEADESGAVEADESEAIETNESGAVEADETATTASANGGAIAAGRDEPAEDADGPVSLSEIWASDGIRDERRGFRDEE